MSDVVEIPCACGRSIRGDDPNPGDELRCLDCGRTVTFAGDLSTALTRRVLGPRFDPAPLPDGAKTEVGGGDD